MKIIDFLRKNNISFEENVNLKTKTWIKTGGTAKLWINPCNKEELVLLCRFLYNKRLSFNLIGYTSNIYFLNRYNPSIIVSTKKVNQYEVSDSSVICECGIAISKLSKICVNSGIDGFSGLVNLPGTVGAAICNNAGCFGSIVSSKLKSIELLTPNGEIKNINKEELGFSHRQSSLKNGSLTGIILSAEFTKDSTSINKLKEHSKLASDTRRKNQEKNPKTLGSIFSKLSYKKNFINMFCGVTYIVLSKLGIVKSDKSFLKKMLLYFYGCNILDPYISDRNLNTFIWKDTFAANVFPIYREFMLKVYKDTELEIEILGDEISTSSNPLLLSFVASENYGAILQAVALQYKLQTKGFSAPYLNVRIKHPLKGLKFILSLGYRTVRVFFGYKKRQKRSSAFKSKHLLLTQEVLNYDDAVRISKPFSSFIVGSDQVWNPNYGKESQEIYLLCFDNEKPKYSYASSFGVSKIDDSLKSKYKNALEKFNVLTTRERTGKEIIADLGLHSDIVLDPTLLLSDSEWMQFFHPAPIIKEEYILCYVMNGDNVSIKYIKEYAKCLNNTNNKRYKIHFIGDKEYKKIIPGYNLITDAGPKEFLNLIFNASYVITNSFHGTCFAVNFNKKFNTILRRSNRFNSRIEDLLHDLNISNRIQYIEDGLSVNTSVLLNDSYIPSLKNLREKSVAYLDRIISENQTK